MIPGPRPSKADDRPGEGRDRGHDALRSLRPVIPAEAGTVSCTLGAAPADTQLTPVALARTTRGWAVVSPAGADAVAGLVEGLTLADLVAEEFGALPEPDRTARRSARGPGGADRQPPDDPVDARVAALERTVAQLEHALAARVSTERAIGVLAERHGTSPRAAFEVLRRDARSQGRPVADLAREVLEGLDDAPAPGEDDAGTPDPALSPVAPLPRLQDAPEPTPAAGDGRS
ncbi:MAG: uncharacterized protein JWP40_3320 [Blastococcus sp.]|nr:uncharacterized protein [Blastococcus sp.]